jgi:hypothetical protein
VSGGEYTSIAQQLDKAELALAAARVNEFNAHAAWRLVEAKERLKIRATQEETKKRVSSDDVEAAVLVMRADAGTEVGQLWLAYSGAYAGRIRQQADYNVLERAHRREVFG